MMYKNLKYCTVFIVFGMMWILMKGISVLQYSKHSNTVLQYTNHSKNELQQGSNDGRDNECVSQEQTLLHWDRLPFETIEYFPRLLNHSQMTVFIHLAREVTILLDKHHVEYIMTSGTLLGSYLMHGL